jgi:hypothetical protein
MALIKKKNKRRHRIQFTMSCELHERYTSYQVQAKSLGLIINFNNDFEEWFNTQLDKIGHELNKIDTGQARTEPVYEIKDFIDNPEGLAQ